MNELNLELFATVNPNTNTTTSEALSPEMKTYYSDYLIDNARPNLVHDQFGQKHQIPANGGKTINFRKFVPFSKASKPLTEGVTPDGGSLSVTNVTSTVSQYGYYVTLSDMLMLTAVDNTLVETTRLLGNQAGSTLDSVTREVLNGGTNVMYAGNQSSRNMLDEKCKLTVEDIYKAARFLKAQNAPKIDGSYVAIVHPDVAYDLMRDSEWVDVNKYGNPDNIFEGEIGKIAGVRFVETTEAKKFETAGWYPGNKNLKVTAYEGNASAAATDVGSSSSTRYTADIKGKMTAAQARALLGKRVFVVDKTSPEAGKEVFHTYVYGININNNYIYLRNAESDFNPGFTPAAGDIICFDDAGFEGRDVYSTLIFGADAYGVTEVTGGGLQHIVKQLGSGGTGDPLNQRATAGWKGTKTAELLVDNYLIRLESASTFGL